MSATSETINNLIMESIALRDTIKTQCIYIRELEDANTPEINELKARVAELEALIADAPHSDSCCLEYVEVGAVGRDKTRPYCNCWKSRALDTKE